MDTCNLRPFSLITASLVNTLICHIYVTQSARLSSTYVEDTLHFFFDFLCIDFATFVILSLRFIIHRIVLVSGSAVAKDISIRALSATSKKCSAIPLSSLLFHSCRTRCFFSRQSFSVTFHCVKSVEWVHFVVLETLEPKHRCCTATICVACNSVPIVKVH